MEPVPTFDRLGAPLAFVCATFAMVACGDSILGPSHDGQPALRVTAAPLTSETDVVIFTAAGDGIADGTVDYVGAPGEIDGPSARVDLDVPDGRKVLLAIGFDAIETAARLADAPPIAYELRDTCFGSATVQTSSWTTAALECSDVGAGTGTVGVSRISLSGDYAFDSADRFAGSFNGTNVSRLVIEGQAQNAAITIPIDAGIHCFEHLPDVWPSPSDWGPCTGAMTNSDGDWLGYIVAAPGAVGTNLAQISIGSEQRWVAIRRAGRAVVEATGE